MTEFIENSHTNAQNFFNTFKIYEFLSDMTELIMEKSHVSALNVEKYVKST